MIIQSPGKLVIAGEYAVLDGAPALVLAVDSGVQCTVTPGGDTVHIDTPDGDDRFVRPALAGAPSGHYCFSAWNPVRLGTKPGFGGSASACVAACLAAGRPPRDALQIHRGVQGSGSGIDVAACIAGGTIRFQGQAWTLALEVCPVVVFSGQSARTGPRVQRYLELGDRADFVAESERIVDNFAADPVGALAESGRLLAQMAARAGLDYLTPSLALIRDLAREHGGAAKPSGAGGGDCAVALFPDVDRETAFRAAVTARGLRVLDVRPSVGARALPPR